MSTETSTTKPEGDSTVLARRRRKAKLSRKNENEKRPRDDEDDQPEMTYSGKKPHITGIKRQARYDPGVPLNRDELTAWRKEARRVRNRESAAASRRRTRDRIAELEGNMSVLETKYAAALKRIVELESGSSSTVAPTTLSQEEALIVEEPIVSPISSPVLTSVVSPVSSPRPSFYLQESHEEKVEQKYQHIMTMISRPTA